MQSGMGMAVAKKMELTSWTSSKLTTVWIGAFWKELCDGWAFIENGFSGLWNVSPLSDTPSVLTTFL
jgi:hypothetical protein